MTKTHLPLAVLFAFTSTVSAEPAVFSATEGELIIPEVVVDGEVYINAVLKHEGNYVFRLFDVKKAGFRSECSSANINFDKYASLSTIEFFAPVTEAQLNELIGCKGVAAPGELSDTMMRWHLPSSTAACPRYIQADLSTDSTKGLTMGGGSIVGINSETNEPRPC